MARRTPVASSRETRSYRLAPQCTGVDAIFELDLRLTARSPFINEPVVLLKSIC
ncbi:MAG: hypothetical protein V7L05_14230 [Nostoc sp.]|uniref:hypothetical protein n=1 Tax=Nostoc sp. TaxID=1180 RepID=UPI002FFC56D5